MQFFAHQPGFLHSRLLRRGVSGCGTEIGRFGPWEPRGSAIGPSGTSYNLFVKEAEFRGSLDSLGNDPGQVYGVSLGGRVVDCESGLPRRNPRL